MKIQELPFYTGLIVMELKLSHRRGGALSLPNQTSTFPSCSLSFCFKRHFRGLTKKWRIQIQEVTNGLNHKHLLVHVVKEGGTLTSISKHYGVSIYSIAAANKNIVDVDLVFEGQHLSIPSSNKGKVQADPPEDGAQTSFEEMSIAYSKFEHDYEKFLAECGVNGDTCEEVLLNKVLSTYTRCHMSAALLHSIYHRIYNLNYLRRKNLPEAQTLKSIPSNQKRGIELQQ